MFKKLGVVMLLATSLAGCYCGPGYGGGYGRAYVYAPRNHYAYGSRHYGYRNRW